MEIKNAADQDRAYKAEFPELPMQWKNYGYEITEKLGEGISGSVYKLVKNKGEADEEISALKMISWTLNKKMVYREYGNDWVKARRDFTQFFNDKVAHEVSRLESFAGAENIVSPKRLGFASNDDAGERYKFMKDRVMEEVKRMFKPEFLNRIDEIIVFHQLTKADMKKILQILLKDLERRCKEQMDIELKVRDTVKEYLVENSFDSKYGARPLKRAIQSKIEDPLAEAILNGEVKKGEPEHLKVKTLGVDGFMLGKQNVALRYIEQLIDSEQTAALGLLLKYTVEYLVDGKRSISETAQWLEQK